MTALLAVAQEVTYQIKQMLQTEDKILKNLKRNLDGFLVLNNLIFFSIIDYFLKSISTMVLIGLP